MNDVKVPSLQDYLYHTGLHYKKLWAEVGNDWKCPACSRTKFQIMRWTKRFPNKPTAFMDWVAALHRHHDHSADILNPQNARFSETVICGQCNSAPSAELHCPQITVSEKRAFWGFKISAEWSWCRWRAATQSIKAVGLFGNLFVHRIIWNLVLEQAGHFQSLPTSAQSFL